MNNSVKTVSLSLLCALSGMTHSGAAAAGSLVHRYSFNQGTANDSVGKANGKLVGGVTIRKGQARFTGKPGERIELLANGPDGININTFKAVTFEAWYTFDNARGWQRVFEFGSSVQGEATHNIFYSPRMSSSNSQYEDSGALLNETCDSCDWGVQAVSDTAETPLLHQVLHVALVVDDKTMTVYLNGSPIAKTSMRDQTGTQHKLAGLSNDYAFLGASLKSGDPPLFGSIEEFRIYDVAFTASEVAASFKTGPNKVIGLSAGSRAAR